MNTYMNYKLSQINISLVLVFTYLMVNLNYNKFWVIRVKFHARGNHEDINWEQTHAGLAVHAPITIICQIMQLYAKLNFVNIIISVNVYRTLSMLFLHRKCFSATNSLHTTILNHQNCFCPNQTKTKSVIVFVFSSYVVFQILPTIVDIIIAIVYFVTVFNYVFGLVVFLAMALYLSKYHSSVGVTMIFHGWPYFPVTYDIYSCFKTVVL